MNWRAFLAGLVRIGGAWAGPAHLPRPLTCEEAWRENAEALRGDWEKVGGDMRRALGRFEAEHPEVVRKVDGE